MKKNATLGHTTCPECDFPDAAVKTDRNGHLYRYCPDCTAQYFTRGHELQTRNLAAKLAAPPARLVRRAGSCVALAS